MISPKYSGATKLPATVACGVDRSARLDRAVFYLCLADLMFLPYLTVLHSSVSLLVLPLWLAYRAGRLWAFQEFRVFLFVTALVFANLLVAVAFRSGSDAADLIGVEGLYSGIVNSVILLYMFGVYLMARYVFLHNAVDLQSWLVAYLLFVGGLAVLFYVDAQSYFSVRSFWTMGGTQIEFDEQGHWHRFTGTLSDPNNAAVVVSAVLAFLLVNYRVRSLLALLATVLVVIIVAATMSRAGMVAAGIVLTGYGAWVSFRYLSKGLVIRFVGFWLMGAGVLFVSFYTVAGTEVGRLLLSRVGESAGRLDRWVALLELERIVHAVFFGQGGVVLGEGGVTKPHNGHFHLIFGFGLFVYLYFIYVFFRLRSRRLSKYLFVVPLLLGFTVNVGIYEPRFAGLMAVMVGVYAALVDRGRKRTRISCG